MSLGSSQGALPFLTQLRSISRFDTRPVSVPFVVVLVINLGIAPQVNTPVSPDTTTVRGERRCISGLRSAAIWPCYPDTVRILWLQFPDRIQYKLALKSVPLTVRPRINAFVSEPQLSGRQRLKPASKDHFIIPQSYRSRVSRCCR